MGKTPDGTIRVQVKDGKTILSSQLFLGSDAIKKALADAKKWLEGGYDVSISKAKRSALY